MFVCCLWVIGHIYVLSHTTEDSLREQRSVRGQRSETDSLTVRYVDVCVGASLLVSLTCLVIGARYNKLHHILVFLILSILVICSYWTYWAGLYYHKSETEASK